MSDNNQITQEEYEVPLYKVLPDLMKDRNVTIDDVLKGTGIPKKRLQTYLKNEAKRLPIIHVNALAKYFNVSFGYIMGEGYSRLLYKLNDGTVFDPGNEYVEWADKKFVEFLVETGKLEIERIRYLSE